MLEKNGDHDFRDSNHFVFPLLFTPSHPSIVQVQTRHMCLVGNVRKQIGHTLAVVRPANRFSEHHGNINALNLGTILHMPILRYGIRNNYSLEASIVYPRHSRTAEYSMSENGVHLGGTRFP